MARHRTASDEVSAALLETAETVLDRDGTEGITIRAVARQAGVAPMGVYNRFGSKEGLLAALAYRALDELTEAISMPTDTEPVQRFQDACRGYRAFAVAHPARYTLIFAVGSPLSDQSSAAAAHGRTVFGVLVELVSRLGADNPVETAQAVWSAIHGAVSIEHAGIGQTPDASASFEHLLTLAVAGLTRT